MACNNQRGTKPYVSFIEYATGTKLTQDDWHDLRKKAESRGYPMSRHRVSGEVADVALQEFAVKYRQANPPQDRELYDERVYAGLTELDKMGVKVTAGTVSVMRYLSDTGFDSAMEEIRADREAAKKNATGSGEPVRPRRKPSLRERLTGG